MGEPNKKVITKLTREYDVEYFDILFLFDDSQINWQDLSNHDALTITIVGKHLQKPWDWRILTTRASVESVIQFNHFPWYWHIVQTKPDFDISIVERFPNKTWNWSDFSKHPKLNLQFVAKYSSKPWNIGLLCKNSMDFDRECRTNSLLGKFCMLCINEILNRKMPTTCISNAEKMLADIYIVWRVVNFL